MDAITVAPPKTRGGPTTPRPAAPRPETQERSQGLTLVETAEQDVSDALEAIHALNNAAAAAVAGALPPSIATLLAEASDRLQSVAQKLAKPLPSAVECSAAFGMLFTPLSFVHGAVALAREADDHILAHLLADVHGLLCAAQVSLRALAPAGLPSPAAPLAPGGVPAAPSTPEFRRLAARANHEIEKLAESLQMQGPRIAGEDHPIVHGIASRIMMLTEIVFYAAALYDGTADECGVPPIQTLQRRFLGRLDA